MNERTQKMGEILIFARSPMWPMAANRRAGVSFAYNRNIRIAVDGVRAPVSLESFMLHTTRATEFPIGYLLHIYVHAGTHQPSNSVWKCFGNATILNAHARCECEERRNKTHTQHICDVASPPPLPPPTGNQRKRQKQTKCGKRRAHECTEYKQRATAAVSVRPPRLAT